MRTFEFHAPTALDEAIELLRQEDRGRPIAGGTDLVVQMKEAATRFPYPSSVISLLRVPELHGVEFDQSNGLRIGATATMTDLANSSEVQEHYAAIAEGAGVVGSVQTMNMATVGGNLCNAAPSADTAPPLLAHDAEVVITGPDGHRSLPVTEFFVGPGETALASDELLLEVLAPAPVGRTGSAYTRHTPRKQMDIAVVGVAAVITLTDDDLIETARIALGAVAPTPIRAVEAEAVLSGQPASKGSFAKAAEAAAAECSPISDIRGSAEFRRHLVSTMTKRLLQQATSRARGD
ncbi:MAG: FAD binding domain-containing protein [Dehalococcoidia bacterium]